MSGETRGAAEGGASPSRPPLALAREGDAPLAAVREPGPRRPRPGLPASFGYALRGLVELAATERNMKLHVFAGLGVCVFGSEVPLSMAAQLAMVLAIALVLGAEALNSALEALVDLHTSEFREEARRAKDSAAGAVLALAVGALVVAAVVVTRSWEGAAPSLAQLRAHVAGDAAILALGAALLALGEGRALAKVGAAGAGVSLTALLALRAVSGPFAAAGVGLFVLAAASAFQRRRAEGARS